MADYGDYQIVVDGFRGLYHIIRYGPHRERMALIMGLGYAYGGFAVLFVIVWDGHVLLSYRWGFMFFATMYWLGMILVGWVEDGNKKHRRRHRG